MFRYMHSTQIHKVVRHFGWHKTKEELLQTAKMICLLNSNQLISFKNTLCGALETNQTEE